MKQNWEQSFQWCLVHEGGYVNHPKDPGGATNQGVTQRVYDAFRSSKDMAIRSVKAIEDQEVRDIYSNQYWMRAQCDHLPSGLDYAVYDYSVNSGVSRASKALQSVLGVTADGDIGQITLAAIQGRNAEDLIVRLCNQRMAFLRRLRHFRTFGRGWTRRVMGKRDGLQLNDHGVIDRGAMLARSEPNIPAPIARNDNAGAKGEGPVTLTATITDALKDNTAVASVAITAGGTILTTLSTPPLAYFVGAALVMAVAVGAYIMVKKVKAA